MTPAFWTHFKRKFSCQTNSEKGRSENDEHNNKSKGSNHLSLPKNLISGTLVAMTFIRKNNRGSFCPSLPKIMLKMMRFSLVMTWLDMFQKIRKWLGMPLLVLKIPGFLLKLNNLLYLDMYHWYLDMYH